MNRHSLALRVARRHLRSTALRNANVVHVDPRGHRWGWFVSPVQRLHVVPLDIESRYDARIWLEDGRGNRSFEVDRHPPAGSTLDIVELRESVAQSRDRIEAVWIRYSSLRGWLFRPDPATIVLYPNRPFAICRDLGGLQITPADLQMEPAANRLYIQRPLNRLLWLGRDDGSDAIP